MKTSNRGMILLEVLVAMMILGSTAIALVGLAAAAVRTEARDRADERQLAEADRVLVAVTLLTKGELDQRIGRHRIGEFSVTIRRPEPELYWIGIGLSPAMGSEELVTAVYRADESGGR